VTILFLDEPTIGLGVAMQRRIRSFIAAYNRRHQATILLTSHYMAEVQALCRRVIVIHHGAIPFDGELRALSDRFTSHKTINVALADPSVALEGYGQAGRWPVGIYPVGLRVLLTFLVPLAFAVTVPAQAIAGLATGRTLLTAVAFTAALTTVTRWAWRQGLRHYSGASA
jgi:ABC-2 type transport system ATP-binding protein